MPPTPPVPAVTITTDPATPIVADGTLPSETTLVFSVPVTDDEIKQNLKVRANIHHSGDLLSVNSDMELEGYEAIIGQISASEGPSNTRTIQWYWPAGDHWFIVNSFGWGDFAPLQPIDFNAMSIPKLTGEAVNQAFNNGNPLFVIAGRFMCKFTLNNGIITYQVVNCNTAVSGSAAHFTMDDETPDPSYYVDNYSCNSSSWAEDATNIKDEFTNLANFNPQNYQWQFGGYIDMPQGNNMWYANDV